MAEEFVLLGVQRDQEISTEHLARTRNTIPWEAATSMVCAVTRVYHADSVLVTLRTVTLDMRVPSTHRESAEGDRNG